MPPLIEATLPYLPESPNGGPHRPYLWLYLTGPNGQQLTVRGIIDTGADISSLPGPYATMLGLDPAQVTVSQGHQVQGLFDVWSWPTPIEAQFPGHPYTFHLQPTFVPGSLLGLWGRADFLMLWDVSFDEPAQTFSLATKEQAPAPPVP